MKVIVCIGILLLAAAVAAVSGCSAIKNATAVGMTKTKCLLNPARECDKCTCCTATLDLCCCKHVDRCECVNPGDIPTLALNGKRCCLPKKGTP